MAHQCLILTNIHFISFYGMNDGVLGLAYFGEIISSFGSFLRGPFFKN